MLISVKNIAAARRIDQQGLADFAVQHKERFGIVLEEGGPAVSSWYCSDLINAFKRVRPESCNLPYVSLSNLKTIVHYGPQ